MQNLMMIKNGDAYALPFTVKLDGVTMEPPDIETVEVFLGRNRKVYPGDIVFDENERKFLLEVSQRESFDLRREETEIDARVKFSGGDVIGIKMPIPVRVAAARSRVEL